NKFAQKTFEEQSSGVLVAELDVLFPKNDNFLGIKVLNKSENDVDTPAIYLNLRDMTLGYRIPREVQYDTDIMSDDAKVTTNKWHNIKIEVNLDNKTNRFYVDGKLVEKGNKNNSDLAEVILTDVDFL